jgi:integrase/recombinase XerD
MTTRTDYLPAVIEQPAAAPPLPALVQNAGGAAAFVWDEFFSGEIRNPNTRRAYTHAVRQFLAWAATQGLELHRIAPGKVGQYIDQLDASMPTKKQHLAALKGFFDRKSDTHRFPTDSTDLSSGG